MRDDIISLETRFAFQEKMINELNEIVYQQQRQIDFLMEQYPDIVNKLKKIDGENVQAASQEAPPPHY